MRRRASDAAPCRAGLPGAGGRRRLWPRSFIVAALKDTGFEVEVPSGYGDLPFPGSLIGYCAIKAAA